MTGAALDVLRTQFVSYNRSTGRTGCLLYQDGLFMQMLEGQREVVTASDGQGQERTASP
ncbi:BLUF domain-containing protein [Thiorhodococcus mannitoliphagus]|uniref:BLUF domain-containing protein n=1 Tax=Thiorhodococcus mannitoliphagus TaxID=329406 RepID=A0A6P1DQQ2_9GAMM|nr:BLUF domain-containing protein [Thiorhodococcus mannitoliphagus]NEX19483.1 BLUF domain-containing protein [Thiorhodococcus mannitoliphagus]